ncbi:hypothetical protein BDY21DRAFT_261908, partial [Lineolata rhizophorae]
PPHELSGHCSVIYDGILYTYSPTAFQSLALSEGGEWEELEMGVPVTGGICVKATPEDASEAALWIVGGTADDEDYPGLQKYSFQDMEWKTITPVDRVTQDRQNHAATYLNGSSSIFMYAGSQDGHNGPSSQTFLISTQEPFDVQAFVSTAPPLVSPMLMPWDDDHAVLVGGSDDNTMVFTFGPTERWEEQQAELTMPIGNDSQTKCTIVQGDDGSKVIELYNMGVSPNEVTRFALLGPDGEPVSTGEEVGAPSSSRRKRRRLAIGDWPEYNATLAPTVTRSDFSIAQDANGLAVISGGDSENPLCIFNERENTWANATALFASGSQEILAQGTDPSSSVSRSVTATATSGPTSAAASSSATAAAPVSSDTSKDKMLTVLGATLGAIFGIAFILILVLLLLKWRKNKRRRAQAASGYINEKDRLSFADRGVEYMSEAAGARDRRYPTASMNASQSSLAIIAGRFGNGHKRNVGKLGSDASTAGLVKSKSSPLGYDEPLEMSTLDEKVAGSSRQPVHPFSRPGPRTRSSGWSRWFANNEATNLAAMPSGRSTYMSDNTHSSLGSQSPYLPNESHQHHPPPPPSSQPPPPFDLGFPPNAFSAMDDDGSLQRLSRVQTGSPSIGHSEEDMGRTGLAVTEGMSAELARANSVSSDKDRVAHGPAAAREPASSWTPFGDGGWNARPTSSLYT